VRGRASFAIKARGEFPMKPATTAKRARLVTVIEISRYLHLHPATVYRLVKNGQLPGFKIGDSWRFDLDQIDQWRLKQPTSRMSKSE
jgi:excisionase family DNA binding protein